MRTVGQPPVRPPPGPGSQEPAPEPPAVPPVRTVLQRPRWAPGTSPRFKGLETGSEKASVFSQGHQRLKQVLRGLPL